MQILIVGIGALGGTIAARAVRAGLPVRLAARNTDSAEALRRSGLRVSGFGGEARADGIDVAALEDYGKGDQFDLILLATKAHDALEVAPHVVHLLASDGVILPIQNGGVERVLADRLGEDKILGGFSNLGATMVEPGVYEQKNPGHLLIGELAGGVSERVEHVARVLGRAIEVKVSSNLTGAIWSKLLINCSVTTLGALCSQTMRQYMETEAGKKVFRRTYEEALSVALAIGIRLERLAVNPIPPGWASHVAVEKRYESWVEAIIAFYGDIKPSMLQDFERGRKTEIDFINGYVVTLGHASGVPVHMNAAITDLVHQIECGVLQPAPERMNDLAAQICQPTRANSI
ncbi:MAG TPA: 2-dehydropantoate 2-reductase [Terriglobales bacterium]|nr:2-dehydropantoate 2-reductase [Terriglobales bacterium]